VIHLLIDSKQQCTNCQIHLKITNIYFLETFRKFCNVSLPKDSESFRNFPVILQTLRTLVFDGSSKLLEVIENVPAVPSVDEVTISRYLHDVLTSRRGKLSIATSFAQHRYVVVEKTDSQVSGDFLWSSEK